MAEVQFTRRDKIDLNEIDEFTEGEWGLAQADIYLSKINSYLELLAEMPLMGRKWKDSGTGLRRSEHGSHVIFYRVTSRGILVCRILSSQYVAASQLAMSCTTASWNRHEILLVRCPLPY